VKRTLLVIITVGLLCFFIVRNNNDPAAIVSALAKNGPVKEGNLVYRIYAFGILPVGYARINKETDETYNGSRAYHLSASAESANYLSAFVRATAQIDSYIDPQTHNPLAFKQEVSISNKKSVRKEITYDQQTGTMTMAGVKRQIMPDTQDALSAIYNIRAADFGKTKSLRMLLNTNQKNYLMEGKAATGEIKAAGKTFKLSFASLEIKRHDGNPYHRSKLSIAMLKDYGNIPVLIKIFASGAMINAKLVKIE